MGQGFSHHQGLSAGPAGIDTPELNDLTYEKSMGTTRFMKSIRARNDDGVVLAKVVAKPSLEVKLDGYRQKILAERKALERIPNALGYERIFETDTAGYLVRQFLYSSLYDRMSTRPFLEDIEKKWLAFQLLSALRDCHASDVFHGDIKSENTLVTSWSWLYLSDFSASFKPTMLPEDNPADFSYFFDTSGRRTCYLAPERFVAPGQHANGGSSVTWAMDIFSAGCVIAELFLETPIFTLSQLFKYKKGEYDPQIHIGRIHDENIRELITNMIQLDPEKRYSAEQVLNFMRKKAFPDYFYDFLHQYMGDITDPTSGKGEISNANVNLGEADERIERIYADFDKISYFLGYDDEKDAPKKHCIAPRHLRVLPVHLDIPNNSHPVSQNRRHMKDDGTLLFLGVVLAAVRHPARATAKVRACDLLLAFSEHLTDEAKLDRVLPFVVSLLNDKSDIVKMAAIRTLTQIMTMVQVISPVNSQVFLSYIIDRLTPFLENDKSKPSPVVRATYAACLGSLAVSSDRILDMVATLKQDGTLPTADTDDDKLLDQQPILHGSLDNTRFELMEAFESHTKALITDSDPSVRQSFLGSVPELCMFFGKADANDIILSHLNTYLNGREWQLKCAFFETIVAVATFLGGVSLEEFILPLMAQALTDPEEYVVEKVLRSFSEMLHLGLFQRAITWDLVDVVARFTMHPNIWIREAAAMNISAATSFLSAADCQCIVLPLIRQYMAVDIEDFSQLSILESLKKPLPRQVLDVAATWAVTVGKGIFWRSARSAKTFSFDSPVHLIPTHGAKDTTLNASNKVAKNEEDDQWINRLRAQGMKPQDEFKLIALKEYISRMAHIRQTEQKKQPGYLQDIIKLSKFDVKPHTVLFDDTYRDYENASAPDPGSEKRLSTVSDALLDASLTIDDTSARRRQRGFTEHEARLEAHMSNLSGIVDANAPKLTTTSPSPPSELLDAMSATPEDPVKARPTETIKDIVPTRKVIDDDVLSTTSSRRSSRQHSNAMALLRNNTKKTVPQTSTTTTNALGSVEGPLKTTTLRPTAFALAQKREAAKAADVRSKHTYTGNNPSIEHMLNAMYIENFPQTNMEFGPMVAPLSRRKAMVRGSAQSADIHWQPAGVLVAQFFEHIAAINRVCVAPDHAFFITGSDDGTVRVWDTGRLERNIAHRSRQTHKHVSGAKVVALCFIENTHCFVSCGSDGSVNIVKVDYVYHSGVTAARYGKLNVVREYQLPKEEQVMWCEHFRQDTSSVLMLATSKSRLLALDVRTMTPLYTLNVPIHHGTPNCFVIDRKKQWILIGTAHGILNLFDLRFKILVRSWGVPGASSIHRMAIHPFRGKGKWVCVAAGDEYGEITTWDLERLQCREVYRPGSGEDVKHPKNYNAIPVEDDKPENVLNRFTSSHEGSADKSGGQAVLTLAVGSESYDDERSDLKYGFLISGGSNSKLHFWDMADAKHSRVISSRNTDERPPTFSVSQPSTNLTLNVERIAPTLPTASNAASAKARPESRLSVGDRKRSESGKKVGKSSLVTVNQERLARVHRDAILDVAVLEAPFGMVVSVDRGGAMLVFQ